MSKKLVGELLKGRVALVTGERDPLDGPAVRLQSADRRPLGLGAMLRNTIWTETASPAAAVARPPSPAASLAARPTLSPFAPAGSSTGIGIGILRQLAAGGATTVMHGLEPEAALQQKAAAISAQYGTVVGTNSANLLHPQEVRCVQPAASCQGRGSSRASGDHVLLACSLMPA
jgi:hypothetical protein